MFPIFKRLAIYNALKRYHSFCSTHLFLARKTCAWPCRMLWILVINFEAFGRMHHLKTSDHSLRCTHLFLPGKHIAWPCRMIWILVVPEGLVVYEGKLKICLYSFTCCVTIKSSFIAFEELLFAYQKKGSICSIVFSGEIPSQSDNGNPS